MKFLYRTALLLTVLLFSISSVYAQLTRPRYFKKVPAGNYSGLAKINDTLYAVVDDKIARDGFTYLSIKTSPVTGEIEHVDTVGAVFSGLPNRDEEGICYVPSTNTLFISAENDNRVLEYTREGKLTGRELQVPADLKRARGNYGLESLTYDTIRHRFFTVTEAPLKGDTLQYILEFNDSLQLVRRIPYLMDKPKAKPGKKANYLHGISDVLALPDGRLLVLEREGFFPRIEFGSWVKCYIYCISPDDYTTGIVSKTLLTNWETHMNILHQDLANYEGMALGNPLPDGRQVIILCADSQAQLMGILRDWFRTFSLPLLRN